MGITLIRIDDRLIHGQVVEGWLRYTHSNHVWVINDNAAGDELQQALLSLATPSYVKLSILSIQQALEKFKKKEHEADSVLVLFSNLPDLEKVVDANIKIEILNIGGMHVCAGKKLYFNHLGLDTQDIRILNKLFSMGVQIDSRAVPMDAKENIKELLKDE
ncbi:MAG: PTS sugar transporter subunit IIB [Elusimicrobiota bacterium]